MHFVQRTSEHDRPPFTRGEPPPLPRLQRKSHFYLRIVLVLAVLPGLASFALIGLRVAGLIHPFRIPTSAMSPTLIPGDVIIMENLTAAARLPRKGTVVVFRTDGVASLPAGEFWVKRVIGEPGDRIKLSPPHLYVNDQRMQLRNPAGEIKYLAIPGTRYLRAGETMVVPAECYFVLGDNSENSNDSRYWGFLPAANIYGRVWYRYGPYGRMGRIH